MDQPSSATDKLLGIEIGGTKLQIVQGDRTGAIWRRWRASVNPERGGSGILDQLRSGLEHLRPTDGPDVKAIAVGFGGPVEHHTGRIIKSHQIHGWDGFPLGQWLREQTGLPAIVENPQYLLALRQLGLLVLPILAVEFVAWRRGCEFPDVLHRLGTLPLAAILTAMWFAGVVFAKRSSYDFIYFAF